MKFMVVEKIIEDYKRKEFSITSYILQIRKQLRIKTHKKMYAILARHNYVRKNEIRQKFIVPIGGKDLLKKFLILLLHPRLDL